MRLGTTFLRTDSDKHLWVILSDPEQNPNQVLLVNMTTADEHKEKVCLLNAGEHPWVTHQTCINYRDAVLTSLDKLYQAKDGGALKLQEPLSESLVKRILAAVPESVGIPLEYAELLRDQALVDF